MRVLIIDDEQYIVEYLRCLVDWQKYGFYEIVATTKATEALQLLEEKTIDLVLSDIRMPKFSGIDLLKKIHDSHSNVRVIFLSGYSDFSYAQTAIHYGAEDYLLKPLTKEQLEAVLSDFIEKYGKRKETSVIQEEDSFDLLLSKLVFNFSLDNMSSSFQSEEYLFFKTRKELTNKTAVHFVWEGQKESWGYCLKDECAELSNADMKFSSPFKFSKEDELRCAFYHLFGQGNYHNQYFLEMAHHPYLQELRIDWKQEQFEDYFKKIAADKRSIFCMECLGVLKMTGVPIPPQIVLNLVNDELLVRQMKQMIALYHNIQRDNRSTKKIINKINLYIEENLEKSLTLDELAGEVFLHPVYLSKLYKQETGENFSNYILKKRMDKACQLLTGSNLMVSDIGKMVGYKTSQYFIKVFKEKFQMTPQQYRRSNL